MDNKDMFKAMAFTMMQNQDEVKPIGKLYSHTIKFASGGIAPETAPFRLAEGEPVLTSQSLPVRGDIVINVSLDIFWTDPMIFYPYFKEDAELWQIIFNQED